MFFSLRSTQLEQPLGHIILSPQNVYIYPVVLWWVIHRRAVLQRVEDGQDAQMAKEALTEATEAEIMLKAWLPGRRGVGFLPPPQASNSCHWEFPTDSMLIFLVVTDGCNFLVNGCFSNKSLLFKEYT